MQELNSTAHKVLDVAERYTQMRGFNAFSYKDLQREVGVKTSSIHYYFPTKQDLALNLAQRYSERFCASLDAIGEEQQSGLIRLQHLGGVYIDVVGEDKFCLCGMLASDMLSLPKVVNTTLCDFFTMVEEWVSVAIALGVGQGQISPSVSPRLAASHFLSSLEGGMLVARVKKNPEYLRGVIAQSLAHLRM